ncbi:MAG: hypothetical protein MJ033_03790 [Victivallaceae bacterium]|nr:hypothetical protein [Victivallaceae bacterium]
MILRFFCIFSRWTAEKGEKHNQNDETATAERSGIEKCGQIDFFIEVQHGAQRQNDPRQPLSGDQDFFFVNKNQVIRTATDKGGGEFFQLASWLFVIDDMSGPPQNRVRAPWWDELKNKNASVKKENAQYIYTLFLEDVKKFATFAIPERVFPPDMPATDAAF